MSKTFQQKQIQALKAEIKDLEDRLGDPCAGSSAVARDLLNKENQLKALTATHPEA